MKLTLKLRIMLRIKEGDSLILEVTSKGILLKPKGPLGSKHGGIAKNQKIEIEEIEDALSKE